jgi:hypothetical protein
VTTDDGMPAFRMPVPAKMLLLQRREYHRAIMPVANPLICEIPIRAVVCSSSYHDQRGRHQLDDWYQQWNQLFQQYVTERSTLTNSYHRQINYNHNSSSNSSNQQPQQHPDKQRNKKNNNQRKQPNNTNKNNKRNTKNKQKQYKNTRTHNNNNDNDDNGSDNDNNNSNT